MEITKIAGQNHLQNNSPKNLNVLLSNTVITISWLLCKIINSQFGCFDPFKYSSVNLLTLNRL